MFVPEGPIGNRSELVQVMAWCLTGDKPLFELMTQLSDSHMFLWDSMG